MSSSLKMRPWPIDCQVLPAEAGAPTGGDVERGDVRRGPGSNVMGCVLTARSGRPEGSGFTA